MPAGPAQAYRLAQLDDYARTPRSRVRHSTPWKISLRMRLSSPDLPGTWGFGLWNDPFGLSLGFGGKPWRLPALPQTTWFMHASPPNWLSLQEGSSPISGRPIPANGFFAGTFRSAPIPTPLLLPGLPALPLLAFKPGSRILRRFAGKIVHQDGIKIDVDVTQWHEYSIEWLKDSCKFNMDGTTIFSTVCSPRSPLGLVIWIDNQFAAWTPAGQINYGTLANPAAWMEIDRMVIQ